MTPDELRALADALEPMARAPRFEDFDVPAFCAWVRAQADAQPVAWRDHVEQRIRGWRQRTMNRSGDRLALDDMMGQDTIDDLIDYVCDEWSDPAPAAPQAEPKREHWNKYFAARAMQPILLAAIQVAGSESRVDFAAAAKSAYRMADEMVKRGRQHD